MRKESSILFGHVLLLKIVPKIHFTTSSAWSLLWKLGVFKSRHNGEHKLSQTQLFNCLPASARLDQVSKTPFL